MHFRNKVLSVEKLEKIDFEQKKLFENKLMGNKLSNIKSIKLYKIIKFYI